MQQAARASDYTAFSTLVILSRYDETKGKSSKMLLYSQPVTMYQDALDRKEHL